jgi:hypothetical protein
MGMSLAWDNEEKTVIRWEFDGEWTWSEYGKLKVVFDSMVSQVDHTVDVIADMSKSPTLPKSSLTQFKKYNRTTPPNRGLIVFVGTNTIVRIMAEALGNVFRGLSQYIAFSPSIDEARHLLTQPLRESA